MKKFKVSLCLLLTLTCVWGNSSYAGVIVGGTRVVYNGDKREASLSVKNPDKNPYLIQAWTDSEGPTGENKGTLKPPFVVTPPLFRLDSGNENMVRVFRTEGILPEDRESVYWMNIKSIPASDKGDRNVLQIAIKTRIKLFYRPKGLNGMTTEDYNKISFKRMGEFIQVENPTPYYISFFSLKLGGAIVDTTNLMTPPKGIMNYPIPSGTSGGEISWQAINDYGGNSKVIVSVLK